ncbi:hypothetical protein GCM10009837_68310 [Streptomyces durmitorensis]|uniref:Uncharacterized protein n=1 Tax=Streptomyces durmitorensis TaxID=319947 RepID=A0ABY4Q833_9ACTN|nr:hypothetical protein [Streptomyces durmitorensis]UQT61299.1 hypothetical protein M4V62_42985 [Streptomyces durmitorensis]
MGSLFKELEAREATARVRVDELEEQLAEVTGRLEEARENLDRLRIARETVSEVMAEMSADAPAPVDAEPEVVGPDETEGASAYAGTERQMVRVLAVPHWRPGMDTSALPKIYRDIVEVVRTCSLRPIARRQWGPTPHERRALLPRVEGANQIDARREEPRNGTV